MDPITIASLALGIAPLIISAVENYEHTFRPFVTYSRYSREIDNFATRLAAQKAIFNNQCQLLLSAASKDIEGLDSMLDNIIPDPGHASRSSAILSARLEDLLGSSLSACESTLRLTQGTLNDIMEETKGFHDVIGQKRKGKGKGLFSHFGQRMKITFAKSRLNDTIVELRLYNDDLRTLSCQVAQVSSHRLAKQSLRMSTISELKTTRLASQKLHSLLRTGWTCQNKIDHAASLSLDARVVKESSIPGIRFSLSLTCMSESFVPVGDAIWLNVESMGRIEDTLASELQCTEPSGKYWQPLSNLSRALEAAGAVPGDRILQKRGGSEIDSCISSQKIVPGPAQGSERSWNTTISAETTVSVRPEGLTLVETIGLPLRSMPATHSSGTANSPEESTRGIEKLCPYFRSRGENTITPRIMLVNHEGLDSYKHTVSKSECPQGFINETKSLRQILQENADARRREAWHSKFQLARSLTLGVLRFQSTPWLSDGLSSSAIQFLKYEPHPGQEAQSIRFPFIQINISNTTNDQKFRSRHRPHNTLARNELLFNLGVLLLELGYDAPLRYLQQPEDIKDGHSRNSMYTDFFTARRISCAAARELDARYGRLAKKCLDCDFGVGENLETVELQDAIVKGILEELDVCIKLDAQINSLLFP
ncbi:hypothetical protein BKA65DRAFT_89681 [Rhexocercosporidium sp. MPI-PUGE-AT-0058]|nr:hypothetical protein BKA65DRAFT_89681 [Rhexocercosporidium sp. MPI-PUGE-AT-0058]